MKILFFAMLRERLGCAEIQLVAKPEMTVADVLTELTLRSAEWQTVLTQQELLAAVNQQFVSLQHLVQAGDEIAFFPPVTGG